MRHCLDSRECGSLVCTAFSGIWQCLWISALFILWKIRCKFVFYHEVSSLSAFCTMWLNEVCHQLLAKGTPMIKDAQSLDLKLILILSQYYGRGYDVHCIDID